MLHVCVHAIQCMQSLLDVSTMKERVLLRVPCHDSFHFGPAALLHSYYYVLPLVALLKLDVDGAMPKSAGISTWGKWWRSSTFVSALWWMQWCTANAISRLSVDSNANSWPSEESMNAAWSRCSHAQASINTYSTAFGGWH